jgi:hypothetical protein
MLYSANFKTDMKMEYQKKILHLCGTVYTSITFSGAWFRVFQGMEQDCS